MSYSHTNSKGVTYYLHYVDVKLRGGKEQRIYYFRKEITGDDGTAASKGTPCQLPDDREVRENPRNGFLITTRVTRGRADD